MAEPSGFLAHLWRDLGAPALLATGGAAAGVLGSWARGRSRRRRTERERQELRDQLLVLAVDTNAGVLAILKSLPCVGGVGCYDERLSEPERQQLAILQHDLDAVRAHVREVWPNGNGKDA